MRPVTPTGASPRRPGRSPARGPLAVVTGLAVLTIGVVAAGWWLTGRDDAAGPLVLDGSPRRADAAGLVVAADRTGIALADGRRWPVSEDLVVFSTLDLGIRPLAWTVGQWVHLDVDGGTVRWVETLARPVGDGSVVVLPVVIEEVTGTGPRRLRTREGLVIGVADGVPIPGGLPARAVLRIDTGTGIVTAVDPA